MEAGGCFVSGGTIGNPLRARGGAAPRPAAPGVAARGCGRWPCSAGAHSSVSAAARVLDVEVVDVPVDDGGHLTGAALRATITAPERLFAVVASAGTTNAGIIDDLGGIADFCDEHGIWLHVDGAYGGAGLASPRLRPQYAGIERAHSFIVDPHKWLFAPYDCCALLYRDAADGAAAHAQHASYLDQVDRAAANPSDLAIHLSRRARGLPFWFSLATHGTERYAAAIDRTVDTARQVAETIDATPFLRLLQAPELTVLLFDRPGWSPEACRRWSDDLAKSGVMLCVPTSWQGAPVLRLAFVNPDTDPDVVGEILVTTMAADDYPG
ncbi:MAG: aminotransferase class V-fold PLP-dependent enzyme [Nocardioides sp.]